MANDLPKDGLTFSELAPASTMDRLVYTVESEATIESLKARVYPGAENTLHLYVFVEEQHGGRSPLVQFEGKDYLDGDNDTWDWSLSRAVGRGDKIIVKYDNTDTFDHNFRVNIDIDYLGGRGRVARALGGMF